MLLPSPLEKLELPLFSEKSLEVFVKRDDLIDAVISGNKWRKLKHNILAAQAQNYHTILTFGGAFSNHIAATARVGKVFGLNTIGVIRGEEFTPLNPTLYQAKEDGMILIYVSRGDYKLKDSPELINKLKEQFGDFYLIPEGGGNNLGVEGCAEIVKEVDIKFDYILTDCGTGATLAGIVSAINENQVAIGIPVLKSGDFIRKEVDSFLGVELPFKLYTDYHFGGYAKHTQELIDFMRIFYKETGIKTDPVYTAKLFFGLLDLVKKDSFPIGSKIVVVHTGGLQGIAGFEKRFGIKIY